jgi:hypothetical protein
MVGKMHNEEFHNLKLCFGSRLFFHFQVIGGRREREIYSVRPLWPSESKNGPRLPDFFFRNDTLKRRLYMNLFS